MKKGFCILLLLIPLLLFCGCSNDPKENNENIGSLSAVGEKLTVKEYEKLLKDYWQEMNICRQDIDDLKDKAEGSFSELQKLRSRLLEACGRVSEVWDKFAAIVPPDEYSELQAKLVKGVEMEKRWLEYEKQAYCADTEEEANEIYGKILQEVKAMDTNDLFSGVYTEIHLKIQGIK